MAAVPSPDDSHASDRHLPGDDARVDKARVDDARVDKARVDDARGAPARAALVPWQVARVAGPSMVPTLRPGEFLVVSRSRRSADVAVGDVVTATFADLPGRVVVKRVQSLHPTTTDGVLAELRSDNSAAGGDSRTHGPGRVHGRVLWVGCGLRWRRPARAPM